MKHGAVTPRRELSVNTGDIPHEGGGILECAQIGTEGQKFYVKGTAWKNPEVRKHRLQEITGLKKRGFCGHAPNCRTFEMAFKIDRFRICVR